MGFPDDYTNISPSIRVTNRYQAIGNSWAVPVVSWVMDRIINQHSSETFPPKSLSKQKSDGYDLYFFDNFVACNQYWINASTYPYDYKLTHMLDIVDTEAEEKYYLSPAGCAGIVRRSIERNAGINPRLKYHLSNGFKNAPDIIHGKDIQKPFSMNADE